MAERKPRNPAGRKPKPSGKLEGPLDPARVEAVRQAREEYSAAGLSYEQALINAIIGAEDATKGLARVAEKWKFDKLNLKPAGFAEKEFDTMPSDIGHDHDPAQEAAARHLAQAAKISLGEAHGVVSATVSKPNEMIAVSKKLLRPKTKFISQADISEDDLNNPDVFRSHIDFANQHKKTNPSMLSEDDAYRLRKARLVRKLDIDRRHMAKLS